MTQPTSGFESRATAAGSESRASTDLRRELEFALRAARRAGDITLEHFSVGVAVETKADASPVTVADRAAEQELRALIRAEFPNDGVLGEEFGELPGRSGRRWILDPIDGTRSFIYGVPLYGVLIALELHGQAVLGVSHFPALEETVWAARGHGCWWQPSRLSLPTDAARSDSANSANLAPRRARVSSVAKLSDALVVTSGTGYFDKVGRTPIWERVRRAARLDRSWGDCYGHCLVATGRAEVAIDPMMHIWDNAALLPILMEAGGTYCDWKGDFTHTGADGISTNGRVLEEVLRLVQ